MLFPKFPTDLKQNLRPNLHLAVFHRAERVPLILISVILLSLPVTARESSAQTLVSLPFSRQGAIHAPIKSLELNS